MYGGVVHLPTVQVVLLLPGQGQTELKMKVMDMYERMHADERPDISIGPFHNVTFKALFEVIEEGE